MDMVKDKAASSVGGRDFSLVFSPQARNFSAFAGSAVKRSRFSLLKVIQLWSSSFLGLRPVARRNPRRRRSWSFSFHGPLMSVKRRSASLREISRQVSSYINTNAWRGANERLHRCCFHDGPLWELRPGAFLQDDKISVKNRTAKPNFLIIQLP